MRSPFDPPFCELGWRGRSKVIAIQMSNTSLFDLCTHHISVYLVPFNHNTQRGRHLQTADRDIVIRRPASQKHGRYKRAATRRVKCWPVKFTRAVDNRQTKKPTNRLGQANSRATKIRHKSVGPGRPFSAVFRTSINVHRK